MPKQKGKGTGLNVVVSEQLTVAIDGQEKGMKSQSSWELRIRTQTEMVSLG